MNKWKKVLIGSLLLAGFALYLQNEKSAEPVWKVNGKEFTLVNSLQDGMKREYIKFDELEVVDNYGFLQKSNKTIHLNDELRTLKFEKIWNLHGRLYILYSVDLKERDKDERDIPRITVKRMELSAKDGKEEIFDASEDTGVPGTRDEGFVFKHRLYRSMMIVPMVSNSEQMDWDFLSNINRIELQGIELADNEGTEPLKNIAIKISSENIYEKVLETSLINKKFTYNDKKEAEIISYDVLLYEQKFSLSMPKGDKDLIGFLGYKSNQSETFVMDIIGTESKGYSIPFYEDLTQPSAASKDKSITLQSSIHKDEQTYTWTVPKEDITKFNRNIDQPVAKNEKIVNRDNIQIVYEGLTKYNERPTIKISVISSNKNDINFVRLIPESYYGTEKIPEEYVRSFQKNLLTITNEKKEKLGNFDMFIDETNSKSTFYINFYKEEINEGATNNIPIPEENLTFTISDLAYSEPLNSPVTIKYKVSEIKK
ncbi:hypothetical protein [Fictibacillus halophilus]|uniref:hypothetical protein n=1 Tax=Fictibacillus halophilus TaxID=1610490 RepID=UPI001CFAFA35|nr:hypothetical protein [Fictibacillus halophilus]